MVSVHCTTVLEHVIKMRASCFNTDIVTQMKLTKLLLIHCFDLLTHAFWANFVDEEHSDNTNNDDTDTADDDKHPRVVFPFVRRMGSEM